MGRFNHDHGWRHPAKLDCDGRALGHVECVGQCSPAQTIP